MVIYLPKEGIIMPEYFQILLASRKKIATYEAKLQTLASELSKLNKEELDLSIAFSDKLHEIKNLQQENQKENYSTTIKIAPLITFLLSLLIYYAIYYYFGFVLKPIFYLIGFNALILCLSRALLPFVNNYFTKIAHQNAPLITKKEEELATITLARKKNTSARNSLMHESTKLTQLLALEKTYHAKLADALIKNYGPYLDSLIAKNLATNKDLSIASENILKLNL